ncbi:MAG: hypothetical protein IT379_04840 [Deltaproteobacteria bacterium]|nr:hypothetical protein [Deltaproteobacteria bacterium]
MFVQRAAIRPVPTYAVVSRGAVATVESELESAGNEERAVLDRAYRTLDREQPVVARYLEETLGSRYDEHALGLGYYLGLAVFMSFREAFPTRLGRVSDALLEAEEAALAADEEMRAEHPSEVVDSDDVLAMEQPAILELIHRHVEAVLEQSASKELEAPAEGIDLDEVDAIYRALLVQVLALSRAVAPPPGTSQDAGPEVLA